MMDETLHTPETDAEAVAAVRRGDAERYRELVERHERRVFAVAWSRLGDATLAEEATQEAFIRGYRRLWLLGDGAKFSGWITSVVRNVAINLGLRHRRELNKRERWALEHPATSNEPDAAAETDPLHTPETLRRTLAELPAAHRECLVLFYLEGKSGTEAAAALGITEAALRVRLHRARAALRERLEEKLAGALTQLRPQKTLVPAIMAGVLTSTTATAATAGGISATVVGTLAKFSPIKWTFALFPLLFALPAVLFSWLIYRAELANYRDPNGFRARIFRKGSLRNMIWVIALLLVILATTWTGKIDQRQLLQLFCGFGLLTALTLWKQVVINHSRFFVVTFWTGNLFLLALLLIGFQVLPFSTFNLFLGLQVLSGTLVYGERPIRMDYNLFLRAAAGLLDLPGPRDISADKSTRLTKTELLAFGRFLGGRWLVDSYRWTAEGLLLRLPPFNFSLWNAMGFMSSWSRRSQLLLTWDNKVSARLCTPDQQTLLQLQPPTVLPPVELEKRVAATTEAAWEHFRKGDFARAERTLGQTPETEVFLQAPARAGFARWRTKYLMVLLALMLLLTSLSWFKPPWLDGLKPVSVTEPQIRDAFANYAAHRDHPNSLSEGLVYALSFNFVLPPTNLMTPEALQAIAKDISTLIGFPVAATNHTNLERLDRFLLALPLANGWFNGNGIGLDVKEATRDLKQRGTNEWKFGVLALSLRRCNYNGESFSMMQLDTRSLAQLRWLRVQNSLNFVERDRLIEHLVSLQVLSGAAVGKRPPLHNWRDLRGLFYTPGWSPLKDTYCSLAALEILGGLDRIDREACIKRILKLHRGKGYFAPPETEARWQLQIKGDAQDTFCAFESLRILGALDRVKDLAEWQFRIKSRRASTPDATGFRTPKWEEIEAWVCQERLARIIRERKANPTAPIRSLLEP